MTRSTARTARHTWWRLAASAGLLIALLGGCTYYLVQGSSRKPGSGSVIAYLDDAGPFWPVLLGVGAVAIVASMLVPRIAVLGHSIAVAVLLAYSAALWWGVAVGTQGWVTASFALALAIHASILTNVYARKEPAWTRR